MLSCITFGFFRFPDIYARENVKAAMLHPFFKSKDFLNGSDAELNLKEKMVRELEDELSYYQELQRESQLTIVNSSKSSSHQTVRFINFCV